ncbi:MAG: universal stress protein [Gemmatimonadetes bacterium]|nr:universal stress protein [Gemmatimonadota bacterium]
MSTRIMVPIDGSPVSLQGLHAARALAGADDVLELAMVVEPTPAFASSNLAELSAKAATSHLEDIERQVSDHGLEVESVVLFGRPGDALVERSGRADMVVVPTHGRGAVSRMWLGSVADHLMREADAPVLLIPVRETADEDEASVPDFRPPQRVLVALDGSEFAEGVLETVAKRFGEAVITLLRVVEPLPAIVGPYLPQAGAANDVLEREREEAEEYLGQVAKRLEGRGLVVRTHVVSGGRAGEAIVRYAQVDDSDLIALATHGAGGIKRMVLGSVADKVVRSSLVPMLVVKPEG